MVDSKGRIVVVSFHSAAEALVATLLRPGYATASFEKKMEYVIVWEKTAFCAHLELHVDEYGST